MKYIRYCIVSVLFLNLSVIFLYSGGFPKSVAVFCASSDKIHDDHIQAARTVGMLCAQHGITIVFGGANAGLMRVLADAALSAGGTVKGVLPEATRTWNIEHKEIQELVYVADIYERYKEFDKADAFIILAGGLGTLGELSNVIAHKQLGIHKKPIIVVNTRQLFNIFFSFLHALVQENTMKQEHLELVTVVNDPEHVIKALQQKSSGFLSHETEWWRQ